MVTIPTGLIQSPAIGRHISATTHRQIFEWFRCRHCEAIQNQRSEEEYFLELVAEWRAATAGLSSPRVIAGHQAYQRIIEMGTAALPWIFRELQQNGGWWYPALRVLTGANPVPEHAKGSPPLNDEAWLEWGRGHGYI